VEILKVIERKVIVVLLRDIFPTETSKSSPVDFITFSTTDPSIREVARRFSDHSEVDSWSVVLIPLGTIKIA